jgi:hypothetical protein
MSSDTVPVAIRVFARGLEWKYRLEVNRDRLGDFVPALERELMPPDMEPGRVEIEFLAEPDPARRFVRFDYGR